ncbi:MAG: response regulator [Bacteroidetes bacterium]|jgi:CheY-like chemotaxis protein|nr:response regulator [Bacteroidota bacterium]
MSYSIKSILLVDDDQDDKYFFSKALNETGQEVQLATAANGAEALEKLQQFTPDVILLDLNMPVMNGVSFLKQIKKNKFLKDIPVIIYTDGLSIFDEAEALKLGAYQVITKPLDLKGTVNVIIEIIKMSFIRMSA